MSGSARQGVAVNRDATAGRSGRLDRGGVGLAVGAYTLWGLFPAFWPLLAPAVPLEQLAHRIVWTAVLMTVVLAVVGGWSGLRRLGAREWALVALAAVLIAVNWGTYIAAVTAGRVVEAALGYYMTPLVSVVLAVLALGERLSRAAWVALGLGAAAVVVIGSDSVGFPWFSLIIAGSFGLYGLVKQRSPLPAASSVTAEAVVLAPVALGYLLILQTAGTGTFAAHGWGHALLLVAAGPVTALPLLLYGAGARRLPLSVFGVLQYLNPTLQFLWGVLVVGEAMSATRWAGFVLVWVALTVFSVDLVSVGRPPGPARGGGRTGEVGEPTAYLADHEGAHGAGDLAVHRVDARGADDVAGDLQGGGTRRAELRTKWLNFLRPWRPQR